MGRLVDIDDVIKVIDKHTNDPNTLDDDISVILEEVKTAKQATDKKTKYRYYISYFHNYGTGYCIIDRKTPVRTQEDVEELIFDIANSYKVKNVTIINWILLN